MRQRRGVDLNLNALFDVGNDALDCVPQDLRPFSFVIFILLAVAIFTFPQVERFRPRGVHVHDVLTRRRHLRVEHRGYEDGDDVLRVTQRSVPVIDRQVRRVQVRQPRRVDAEEEVHDAAERGYFRHVFFPVRRAL